MYKIHTFRTENLLRRSLKGHRVVTRFALADGVVVDLYTGGMLVSKRTCLPVETLITKTHSCKQIKK